MLCKVNHCCTGRVSANTRSHQLCLGDWEMGTAISCTEYSQVSGIIKKAGESSLKAQSLQLSFVQLPFI